MSAPSSALVTDTLGPLAPRRISEPGCHATPGWTGALLHPLREDYATAPVEAGFDWAGCLASASGGSWFLVVFRSTRRADANGDVLTEFDDEAHLEARDAGGLRLYFKGVPDAARRCLSLCLWDSAEQAHGALRLPRHQAAVRIAHRMYERFALERHVVVRDPETRQVRVRPV